MHSVSVTCPLCTPDKYYCDTFIPGLLSSLSCCAQVRVYGRFTTSLGEREPVPGVLLVCGLGDVPSPTLPSPTHSIACFCDFEDRRIPASRGVCGIYGYVELRDQSGWCISHNSMHAASSYVLQRQTIRSSSQCGHLIW